MNKRIISLKSNELCINSYAPNGAKYTAEALDTMIKTLKDAGYQFVPVSELIYRDNYHMDHEGRQISDKK